MLIHILDQSLNVCLSFRPKDWGIASEWYERAVGLIESQFINEAETEEPLYAIKAKLADMYKCGGYNVKANPQKSGWCTIVFL
jgi:hypothetical protein